MQNKTQTANLSSDDDSDANKKRKQLLENIRSNGNLPAIGAAVSKVVAVASANDEAVRNLAQLILSDVALTQKVLRVANAACFRINSSTPITTVSKAIFLLGFETVKSTALALMLVDGMAGSRGKNERSELAHALTASVVGRELARRSQFRDAEEAAVAALFKNIGRLLVAAHDHASYVEIMEQVAHGTSPSLAEMRVIGGPIDAIGVAMLEEWQIPDTIISAPEPLPGGTLKVAKTKQEWVQQVAAFSTAAAKVMTQADSTAQDVASRVLVERFGTALGLDQSKLEQLFTVVQQEAKVLTGTAGWTQPAPGISGGAAGARRPARNAAQEAAEDDDDLGLPDDLLMAAPTSAPLQTDQRHPSGKPVNARDLLLAGVQDVTEMMASGRCKANDLIMLVLETLHRSLGFRFATVCLKDVKSGEYRARISLGENNAARQAQFNFPSAAARNLFHLAMEKDADLLISDASDPKIKGLIPAWHRALLPDARSFIVLPLVVQGKPLGLFYADRTQPAPEGVPPDETSLIKTLKGQVLTALNSR